MSGFIKLHRDLMKWEWYDDGNTMRLFIHLLINSNYKPSRYHGHEVPEGSCVTGRIKLAEELNLSQQQIRTSLNKLKSTSEITIKITNKFSIISITKWHEFQDNNQQDNQQVTNKQPTSNQQVTTSKEVKNIRKKEKRDTRGSENEFLRSEVLGLMKAIKFLNGRSEQAEIDRENLLQSFEKVFTLPEIHTEIHLGALQFPDRDSLEKHMREAAKKKKTTQKTSINDDDMYEWKSKLGKQNV